MSNKKFISIIAIALISLIISTNLILIAPVYATNTSYVETLFAPNSVADINIVIDEADLEALRSNPLYKEIYNATIIINGEKVSNVGIRTKGDSTLSSLARDTSTDRYSFKIDFDYYESGKSYYGLTKLNLNCAYQDSSYMKNYLAYKLFKMMNVPYCESSFAYIKINGQDFGLYEMIEGIEEPYLIKNFGLVNSTGDLYKPDGTGSDLKWLGDDYDLYTGMNLKTNKETTDNSALISFLDYINNGNGEELEKYLNVDEALRYFAINTALSNLDSYQGNMKHNYYLYEINGVFQILPWDFNLAFGGFGGTNISIDNPTNGKLEDRPLLNILLSNDEYKQKYYDYLSEVATIFVDGTLKNMIDETANLIEPYVKKDPTKFCTMEQFYESVDTTGKYETTAVENDQPQANLNKDMEMFTSGLNENMEMPPDIDTNDKPKDFGGRGMGNTGNLLNTAAKLSESILKQISGELTVEVSSMGGKGRMRENNENQPPNMNLETNEDNKDRNQNFIPSDRDKADFKIGGMGKDNNQSSEAEKIQFIMTTGCSIILLIIATFGVFLFKKKRYQLH